MQFTYACCAGYFFFRWHIRVEQQSIQGINKGKFSNSPFMWVLVERLIEYSKELKVSSLGTAQLRKYQDFDDFQGN